MYSDDVALADHTHGGQSLNFPAVGTMQSGFQISEDAIHEDAPSHPRGLALCPSHPLPGTKSYY